MSTDEMITHLGSCQARADLAAMVNALSLNPSLNTPVEAKRLEAARAAMVDWKAYSAACQARHNARRLLCMFRVLLDALTSPSVESTPSNLPFAVWWEIGRRLVVPGSDSAAAAQAPDMS